MTRECLQSVCGIAVVKDYYRLKKFNLMEIAKAEEPGFKSDGRVGEKDKVPPPPKDENKESS